MTPPMPLVDDEEAWIKAFAVAVEASERLGLQRAVVILGGYVAAIVEDADKPALLSDLSGDPELAKVALQHVWRELHGERTEGPPT